MTEENKNDIEEIARILRETVKADLETLSAQHNNLVENAIDVIDKSLEYEIFSESRFNLDFAPHFDSYSSCCS